MTRTLNEVSAAVIAEAIHIHRALGPGLLESVYETVLAAALERAGWLVVRQRAVDVEYDGLRFPAAFRVGVLVNDALVVEVKSVERLTNLHAKQLLTYLRLTNRSLGLLLNFSGETMKEGIRRVVNNHNP